MLVNSDERLGIMAGPRAGISISSSLALLFFFFSSQHTHIQALLIGSALHKLLSARFLFTPSQVTTEKLLLHVSSLSAVLTLPRRY
jgi:hypothetical protein